MDWLGRLRSNAAWLYGAEALPRLVALVVVPIWSARVPPAEYARWVLALTTVEILRELAGLGLADYLTKVAYRYYDDERLKEYFGLGAAAMLASTAAVSGALALASPWLSGVLLGPGAPAGIFAWLALYVLFSQVTSLALLWAGTRVEYRTYFALLSLRTVLTTTFLLVFLLGLRLGFYAWVWGTVCAEALLLPLSAWSLRGLRWRWRRRLMRFGVRFSGPFFLTNIFLLGQDRIGRYVLGANGLGAGVGLYGVAQSFALNYGAAIRPVKVVALRILGQKLEKDADSPYYLEFFHGFACVALSAAFVISLFLGDLLRLFVAPAYYGAAVALPLLVFAAYHQELFSLYGALMFRHFKVWFQFLAALVAFTSVMIVSLVAIPTLGIVGAAGAQLTGSVAMAAFADRYASAVQVRGFRLLEKSAFMMLGLIFALGAEWLTVPFVAKMMICAVVLPPYLFFYWRRRRVLFPRTAELVIGGTRPASATGRT